MKSNFAWIAVALVACAVAALTENPGISILAVAVLSAGLLILRRVGFPPVLAFVFGYQWLQASTQLFEANLGGAPLNTYVDFVGDVETATVLSLAGLMALVSGMWFALRKPPVQRGPLTVVMVEDRPASFWLWCYLVATAIALACQALSGPLGGLRQPLLAMASLKWAFFLLFTQAAFRRRGRTRTIWIAAFLLEIGLGTVGFFSDFKLVLFFTVFGVMSAGLRMSPGRVLGLVGVGMLSLFLAVGWTAVKVEQRRFLSGGEKMQASTATSFDALENLVELASDLDGPAMIAAAKTLAERLAYVEYFGRVLDMVPSTIPYERGEIWIDAVTRPLMPRLLFPNKTEIDDTERSIYYAGLPVGPFYAATSISLGYMAESYIDFGRWLMMLPIFALGWLLARFYRWCMNHPRAGGDVGMALASAVLIQAAYLEHSITKMFGGIVVGMLCVWLVARYVIPRVMPRAASPRRDLVTVPPAKERP